MRIGSTLIFMGLSLCPAMAVELTPSASITPSIITTNLRGSTMPQGMMPIEEAGKDTWNPSSPSGNNLPWALLQPWISAGGNNRDPRYPAGQQLPGGAWQDVDGYYGGGRRGGASTGPCVHAFTPSDCFAVPTGECFWDNSEADGGRCESRFNEGRCGRLRSSSECYADSACFWDVSEANGGRCEDRQ